MTNLKPGDTVRLKSGGPEMMIEALKPDDADTKTHASCIWFVRGKRQSDDFQLQTLEIAPKRGIGAVGLTRT